MAGRWPVELVDASPNTTVLYHYTNKAGYEGIQSTEIFRPSTIPDVKNTHYGVGVYFSEFSPAEMNILGHADAIKRVFADVSEYSVDRMQYYFEVRMNPAWNPKIGRFYGSNQADIYIVEGRNNISVPPCLIRHGKTDIAYARDKCPADRLDTFARDYAYQLNHPEGGAVQPVDNRTPAQKEDAAIQTWKKDHPMVFINGVSQKRPDGYLEDYYTQSFGET